MKKTRVTIVEDEIIIAMSLKQQLESEGYEIIDLIATGEDALMKIAERKPDFILMDINLRGSLDGISTMRMVQEKLSIPFAFMTGYNNQDLLESARALKPAGILLKPINISELGAIISSIMKDS